MIRYKDPHNNFMQKINNMERFLLKPIIQFADIKQQD